MCELHPSVREKTDALDAAGNTTAAIGKGFAIGSACLVGLALFGAFVTRLDDMGAGDMRVDLLDPITFAGLLIGAMLPYWFSALTMKSVGKAANAMVIEIKRQFDANPNLLIPNHPDRPDYDTCIKISTDASLEEVRSGTAIPACSHSDKSGSGRSPQASLPVACPLRRSPRTDRTAFLASLPLPWVRFLLATPRHFLPPPRLSRGG
eukprot:scaffold392_cov101-Isochrysis_galbana.AAC.7